MQISLPSRFPFFVLWLFSFAYWPHHTPYSRELEHYKTSNFLRPISWLKRVVCIGLFLIFMPGTLIVPALLPPMLQAVFVLGIMLLFVCSQIDELEITDTRLIVSQRSLLPFLSSRREYLLTDIEWIKKNGNTILGDSIVVQPVLYIGRKALEIRFRNGDVEIIRTLAHKPNYLMLWHEIYVRVLKARGVGE